MKLRLLIVVAVIAVFFGAGLRVAHPQDGLSSALGSAKSSIAIYKGASDYKAGQKIIVVIEGSGNQLGVIKSATKDTVDVDTGAAFTRVKQEDVVGKLVGVIPFFGVLFGFVGL